MYSVWGKARLCPGGWSATTLNISQRPDLIMTVRRALWYMRLWCKTNKESTQRIICSAPDNRGIGDLSWIFNLKMFLLVSMWRAESLNMIISWHNKRHPRDNLCYVMMAWQRGESPRCVTCDMLLTDITHHIQAMNTKCCKYHPSQTPSQGRSETGTGMVWHRDIYHVPR